MRLFLLALVAAAASASGFVVHVVTVEWLPTWVASQMHGVSLQPSWSVKYIAGATSLEYGIAAVALYYLARDKLLSIGLLQRALLFSVLLMGIHGAFIRQPLMDYVIGNPLRVVLVQNFFKWLLWLLMSFWVVFGFELVNKVSGDSRSVQPLTRL
jgi:hypothetical protein